MALKVYLGRWRWHGLVAVKHLKVADARRERAFACEAQLLRTLRHPNIVSLLGACLEPGRVRCKVAPTVKVHKPIAREEALQSA